MGSTDGAGDSRNSAISPSVFCACGWNTSTRFFANTVDFYLSLFAHLSWVGVSKRKGGDDSIGVREDLIGFQIELSYRYIMFD
jgi:hypothetical protein